MTVLPHAVPLWFPPRPEATGGRPVGVLLVHGFTSTPDSMRAWAEALAGRGYAVDVPLLPGRGTTWQELNRTHWEDWYDEVDRTYRGLRAPTDAVVVGGLSMGSGLALTLAADRPDDPAGLALVNPSVNTERKDVRLLPVLKRLVPAVPPIANDIRKPGEVERPTDGRP